MNYLLLKKSLFPWKNPLFSEESLSFLCNLMIDSQDEYSIISLLEKAVIGKVNAY